MGKLNLVFIFTFLLTACFDPANDKKTGSFEFNDNTVSASSTTTTKTNTSTSTNISTNTQSSNATSTSTSTATDTAPIAPTNVAATTQSSTSILITWADNSSNETGFTIYRSVAGGAFTALTTKPSGTNSYTDTNLTPSTQYTYKIDSYNGIGKSAQISTSTVTTSPPPSTSSSSSSGGSTSSSSSSSSSGGSTVTSIEKGLWVWRKTNWVNDTALRTTLFNFALTNGFNTLYVDVESDFTNSNTTNLKSFVEAGAVLGLKFRFLLGASGAIPTSRATNFVANTSNLKNQLSVAGKAALQGVQYDVETYISGSAAELAPIAIAVRNAQQTQYQNILVDFCIPRWFDGQTYNGRKLSEVIQDNSDIVTLMDYVVSQSTIVTDAQTEVTYAKQTGKKVTVGLETICSVPASQSFCTLGKNALNSALSYLDTYIANKEGYNGHAVHYYESLNSLQP